MGLSDGVMFQAEEVGSMCDNPVPHHISENSKGHNGRSGMKDGEGGKS